MQSELTQYNYSRQVLKARIRQGRSKIPIKHFLKQIIIRNAPANSIAVLQNPGMELVDVGYGTYGANHLIIHSWDSNTKIKIGKYCSIADSIHIFLGGNHDIAAVSTYPFGSKGDELVGPREGHPKSNGDIKIGNDVWIGSNVSIMSGITIGDGAVIAAFSHVVKDVQPYEIVGGNPAKQIRMRFDQETIDKLMRIKWWDWEESKIIVSRDELTSKPTEFLLKHLPQA